MAKFGPFKRKKDWRGQFVRFGHDVETQGGVLYPKETVWEIDEIRPGSFGFHLRTPVCHTCGFSAEIWADQCSEFEIVDPDEVEQRCYRDEIEKSKRHSAVMSESMGRIARVVTGAPEDRPVAWDPQTLPTKVEHLARDLETERMERRRFIKAICGLLGRDVKEIHSLTVLERRIRRGLKEKK